MKVICKKFREGFVMEKFVEKFNIFDIFTMLLPGIVISSLFGISLSFKYYEEWENWGNEKYILFFIISYACGLIFQEMGTVFDKKFMFKILYGGEPRKIFLLENKYTKIFNDELSYKDALRIKQYLNDYVNIETSENVNEEELNSLMFAYCLNICEMNGLAAKADKMIVISEMSRSLFWGCIATIVLNIIMVFVFSCHSPYLYGEIPFLFIIAIIFLSRKRRYEQYRIRILLRMFLIYTQKQMR